MERSLEASETSRRRRALVACIPCRERKRKCDGQDPCCTCISWGYECYYLARRRRRSRKVRAVTPNTQVDLRRTSVQENPVVETVQTSKTTDTDRIELVRRLEANSGAAFVRKLGLKIDPARAPKLNLFSWNIGARACASQMPSVSTVPIVEIMTLEDMQAKAQVYFDKVHPCYGFMDPQVFFERLALRWNSLESWNIFDSTIAGVVAIGCFFSNRQATIPELHLVRTARHILEMQHLAGPPSIDLLTGWTLRSIYLRMTDTPHSTWVASSTLMHLIEAAGLHPEPQSVLPARVQGNTDIQRRIVGMAHHLNVWTSYDLGLSRVSFQNNELPTLPSPRQGDLTIELLRLLPVSLSLDPSKTKNETDLTSALSDLLRGDHTQPPSVMAQCNLVLCILRRLHTQNLNISPDAAAEVLSLLKLGLQSARSMVASFSPWHHAANVPFHIICVLLVMDTRPSLAMLPEAMETVKMVANTWDTETMREAYNTACLLVMLHQQRRKDDLAIFSEALLEHRNDGSLGSTPYIDPSSEEYSWLGALVADLPGLQRVDLDQFLGADIQSSSFFGISE
ncbi:Fungal Zn(2)-Cys(6) binuclear cluster domain-containing protein [Penicillium ucsense]|uniref:Fungal Zn(2)-Cys(6) binuclear cluster domain-containing protein n=1 Tax=Penicillium ucsense TaxID=2839758 RepID=A0A8J8VWB7_9EURO|nr:Fungal Zn(2)-Cys(6) binuclear cluster domain-containing protein [Penicillium ucsense]KAF7730495.1 Fungal Zn(2)-Cys(6) binuclear cluster domain-containing protein [Penicillium ucsense]